MASICYALRRRGNIASFLLMKENLRTRVSKIIRHQMKHFGVCGVGRISSFSAKLETHLFVIAMLANDEQNSTSFSYQN